MPECPNQPFRAAWDEAVATIPVPPEHERRRLWRELRKVNGLPAEPSGREDGRRSAGSGGRPRPSPGLVSSCINGHEESYDPEKPAVRYGKFTTNGVEHWGGIGRAPGSVCIQRVTQVSVYSSEVVVKRRVINSQVPTKKHAVRGAIGDFSEASCRRLKFTARNVEGLVTLLTLTYPAEFPTDGRKVKQQWAAMRHWLTRQGLAGLWFQEFQERGAPHFHVFLTGEVDHRAVRAAWYRIAATSDPKHLLAGTRVERIRQKHAAASYATKYCAKREQKVIPPEFTGMGRFWGLFGGLKVTPTADLIADDTALVQMVRLVRRANDAYRRSKGLRPVRDKGRGSKTFYAVGQVVRQFLAWVTDPGRCAQYCEFFPGELKSVLLPG